MSMSKMIRLCFLLPNFRSVRSALFLSCTHPSGFICKILLRVKIHSSISCSFSAASTKYVKSFIFNSKACFRSLLFYSIFKKKSNYHFRLFSLCKMGMGYNFPPQWSSSFPPSLMGVVVNVLTLLMQQMP